MTDEGVVRELVEEVLSDTLLLSLGTVDDGGVWVADVIVVHDEELRLYWLSRPDVRHSRAIEEHPQVAGTVTVCEESGRERAVQLAGVAEGIERFPSAVWERYWEKRGKERRTWEEYVEERAKRGYVLEPTKIELIHEERFGREKQVLDLP
jgi:nitroimidazol reductase NimA-like FMN-containing flavoprotein (pyridoxamine 5'-phosphate oxidase superfamily)